VSIRLRFGGKYVWSNSRVDFGGNVTPADPYSFDGGIITAQGSGNFYVWAVAGVTVDTAGAGVELMFRLRRNGVAFTPPRENQQTQTSPFQNTCTIFFLDQLSIAIGQTVYYGIEVTTRGAGNMGRANTNSMGVMVVEQ
jgi:hypothetical protein